MTIYQFYCNDASNVLIVLILINSIKFSNIKHFLNV